MYQFLEARSWHKYRDIIKLNYFARLRKSQVAVNIMPTYSIVGQLYKNLYIYALMTREFLGMVCYIEPVK
jgi:hypothetical protein